MPLIDSERLSHSIKIVIACIIGIIVTQLFATFAHFPQSPWILISIIVVMCGQMFVGSVVQRSYWRFLGTITGCLFAMVALMAFGHSDVTAAIIIGLSTFIFSYIAVTDERLSYACTLGAATTAIIMLDQHPTLLLASQRFIEISSGVLIAGITSQFILPIHARTHLRRTQAKTLRQLRDYYVACMVTRSMDTETLHYEELEENIIKSLLKQRQLAKESANEPFGPFFDPLHFMQSLQCEREMLRAINLMHQAMSQIKTAEQFIHSDALRDFNDAVLQSLDKLILYISHIANAAAMQTLPAFPLQALRDTVRKDIATLSQQESIHIDGFLFASDMLVTFLLRLATLGAQTAKNTQ